MRVTVRKKENRLKKFIITIDTEKDNGWEWGHGDSITTENAAYMPRFQTICEKYGFKPTYLATYEMMKDKRFVELARDKQLNGLCEVGLHPHPESTPPEYVLTPRTDMKPGHEFLKEYPAEIIFEKISNLKELYVKTFECEPKSHRAAKWGMDDTYYQQLEKLGIPFDCSVTPGRNWKDAIGFSDNSFGPDYSKSPRKPYMVTGTHILEIPLTTCKDHRYTFNYHKRIKKNIRNIYRAIKGVGFYWLRPNGKNLEEMLYVVNSTEQKSDYLMFMMHSSEMMPGGSPTFDTEEKIEKMYSDVETVFSKVAENYEGITLSDYGQLFLSK